MVEGKKRTIAGWAEKSWPIKKDWQGFASSKPEKTNKTAKPPKKKPLSSLFQINPP